MAPAPPLPLALRVGGALLLVGGLVVAGAVALLAVAAWMGRW